MTLDPNDRLANDSLNSPRTTPEYQNNVEVRRSSSWVGWVAVIAVLLVGAFVWSQMGGSSADPQTTSSTTPPAVENTTPAPAPMTPAAPPAANPAPAAPPAGGAGSQP